MNWRSFSAFVGTLAALIGILAFATNRFSIQQWISGTAYSSTAAPATNAGVTSTGAAPTDTSVTGTIATGNGTRTTGAENGTSTTVTAAQANVAATGDSQQDRWARFEQSVIADAKKRPPDYQEVVSPGGMSSPIDCHQHKMRIWAFDLTSPAEAYWFWGGTADDMVVAPCRNVGGWINCTPTTDSQKPPTYARIHNLDTQRSMSLKLWFVPYTGPGDEVSRQSDDWRKQIPPGLLDPAPLVH